MKKNAGLETLIPKSQWVKECEIQGVETKTLRHPIVEQAFRRILELYEPKHSIALVSLCTSSRPYSTSRKWKTFKKLWGDKVDLIICSNGGVIPIEFESCYPYLTYDAHGESKYDKEYIDVCYRRLCLFFGKFKYKRIIFNFRPTLRNRRAAEAFKKKSTSECFILPSLKVYGKAKAAGFPCGKMFPDLDDGVLKEMSEAINKPFFSLESEETTE